VKFYLKANVSRRVDDVIQMTVEASDEDEAIQKAEKVLNVFPSEVIQLGIDKCVVVERQNHQPDTVEIFNTREGLKVA
jgi:hypothetical protein